MKINWLLMVLGLLLVASATLVNAECIIANQSATSVGCASTISMSWTQPYTVTSANYTVNFYLQDSCTVCGFYPGCTTAGYFVITGGVSYSDLFMPSNQVYAAWYGPYTKSFTKTYSGPNSTDSFTLENYLNPPDWHYQPLQVPSTLICFPNETYNNWPFATTSEGWTGTAYNAVATYESGVGNPAGSLGGDACENPGTGWHGHHTWTYSKTLPATNDSLFLYFDAASQKYVQNGWNVDGGLSFSITNGSGTYTLYSQVVSGGWATQTIDISQFKNQSVTLTFDNFGAGTLGGDPDCDNEMVVVDNVKIIGFLNGSQPTHTIAITAPSNSTYYNYNGTDNYSFTTAFSAFDNTTSVSCNGTLDNSTTLFTNKIFNATEIYSVSQNVSTPPISHFFNLTCNDSTSSTVYFSVIGGLNVSAFELSNSSPLTNWNVNISNGTTSYALSNLNASTFINSTTLPSGNSTVTFSKTNYVDAVYSVDLNGTSVVQVNGYLFNSSSSSSNITNSSYAYCNVSNSNLNDSNVFNCSITNSSLEAVVGSDFTVVGDILTAGSLTWNGTLYSAGTNFKNVFASASWSGWSQLDAVIDVFGNATMKRQLNVSKYVYVPIADFDPSFVGPNGWFCNTSGNVSLSAGVNYSNDFYANCSRASVFSFAPAGDFVLDSGQNAVAWANASNFANDFVYWKENLTIRNSVNGTVNFSAISWNVSQSDGTYLFWSSSCGNGTTAVNASVNVSACYKLVAPSTVEAYVNASPSPIEKTITVAAVARWDNLSVSASLAPSLDPYTLYYYCAGSWRNASNDANLSGCGLNASDFHVVLTAGYVNFTVPHFSTQYFDVSNAQPVAPIPTPLPPGGGGSTTILQQLNESQLAAIANQTKGITLQDIDAWLKTPLNSLGLPGVNVDAVILALLIIAGFIAFAMNQNKGLQTTGLFILFLLFLFGAIALALLYFPVIFGYAVSVPGVS